MGNVRQLILQQSSSMHSGDLLCHRLHVTPHDSLLSNPHLKILNFIASANSLWPCRAIYTRVLGIRRWTSLGRGRHSACHDSLRTDLEAANKSRHFSIKRAWIQTVSLPCAVPVSLSSSSSIQNDSTNPLLASQSC